MKFLLLLPLLAFLASCGSNKTEQRADNSNSDTTIKTTVAEDTTGTTVNKPQPSSLLSKVVHGLLDARYEGKWLVVNDSLAQWPQDVFDYFVVSGRKKDTEYPYLVKGDFNGDGENDVAALVKQSTGKEYQLAIILRKVNKTDKSEYHFWKEDMDLSAISLFPKGELVNMDAKPVTMKGDGITVEYYEKASFVIYWDGKGFKRVYTGD